MAKSGGRQSALSDRHWQEHYGDVPVGIHDLGKQEVLNQLCNKDGSCCTTKLKAKRKGLIPSRSKNVLIF